MEHKRTHHPALWIRKVLLSFSVWEVNQVMKHRFSKNKKITDNTKKNITIYRILYQPINQHLMMSDAWSKRCL